MEQSLVVYVLRHAESEFNVFEQLSCERSSGTDTEMPEPGPNCSITEHGESQASKLTGSFDLIVCSPLKRCLETLGKSTIKSDHLVISYLLREQIQVESDLLEGEVLVDSFESREQCDERALWAYKLMHRLSRTGLKVLFVSHSDILHSVLCHFQPLEIEKSPSLPNAVITEWVLPPLE